MPQFVLYQGRDEYSLEQLGQNAYVADLYEIAEGAGIGDYKKH